jgi:3-hydroxyisobutyrate dehydrogenase
MEPTQKKIGFIGLGTMGKPMAANIAKAGFALTVFDIREEPLAELAALGASVATSGQEVGESSDAVIVMVADYAQLKEVVFPPRGALGGMSRQSTLIITSTISPKDMEEVAAVAETHGMAVIDAPVSGGATKAEEGSLSLMVGGDEAVVRENEDVLQAIGEHVFHIGSVGQGQTMKLINQILVSANIVSVAEAMTMAKKLGLDLPKVVDIISKSAGDSFVLRTMAPRMVAGDFTPKSAVSIFTKDTGIIMNTGMALDIPLPVSSLSYQVYRMAEARGLSQQDVSSLVRLFEEFARL